MIYGIPLNAFIQMFTGKKPKRIVEDNSDWW